MTDRSQHAQDYSDATHYQRLAADPRATRLAAANAGSGKTRVLVARVSRLLLDGADPGKILCLTYTKAAASEMQTRLFETLGKWSVMDADALNAELDELLGETLKRDTKELGKARRLFARALETPEGLKVQTIHAFCERVLSRFPIEAGILPGFEPMDDADVLTLRQHTEDAIYREAWNAPEEDLANAINVIAGDRADMTLDGLFRWMAGNNSRILKWKNSGGIETLAGQLGLGPDSTPYDQYVKALSGEVKHKIKSAALNLQGSSNANDRNKADTVLDALTHDDPVEAFETYADIILTKSGGIRSGIVTKSAPETAQSFFGIRGADTPKEPLRVYQITQNILAAQCLHMTRAVYVIAQNYVEHYTQSKAARRWLDFNDQIEKVRDLLIVNEVADWVRYKLDGGIGHILVDEAQDTAPDQWDIIDALKDGFKLPDPDWPKEKVKTFFAVGDEKQSIYSFQGARPELFLNKIKQHVSGGNTDTIKMSMSFRSASEILRVVDAVLIDHSGMDRMFNTELIGGTFQVPHTAFRQDHGQVELWPLAPPPDDPPEELPWDTTPVDAPSQASSRERLAREIATSIKNWLNNKEPIFDRELKDTRAMRAGDILILVRNRGGGFFDAIIRNLKQVGVPVAGADRLVLKDAIVVKDLLALTRFVLLPADDLSLAEVLKSPFFGFTDEALFEIAHGRKKTTLWQALKASSDVLMQNTVTTLKQILTFSRHYAPYEFYARVLDMNGDTPRSMRERVHARLGIEAKDVLEAFLARALAHQRRGAPSLQHFLQAFQEDDQDIKREMESGSGEVRVMTVHGAKGLEAPVVILPDTTQVPSARSGSGLFQSENGFAYIPSKSATPEILAPLRETVEKRALEEYMRLLYVAMTRAESRLVVCGYHSDRKTGPGFKDGSWYAEVSQAMETLTTQDIQTPFGEGKSYGTGAVPVRIKDSASETEHAALPAWISDPVTPEPPLPTRVTPSHLLAPPPGYEMAVRSPLVDTVDRFRRGNLIHKLLEILPDIALENRHAIATDFLESHKDLTPHQRSTTLEEVFAVLENPDFAHIFKPGSRAEVSLAGRAKTLPKGLYLNAQIDRLAVTDTEVVIVDYKSNRPPPKTQDGVADIYWGQMAAYRELAREIYPNHIVKCALLWTDGPRLMILDDHRLDIALTQIASVPTYGTTENLIRS